MQIVEARSAFNSLELVNTVLDFERIRKDCESETSITILRSEYVFSFTCVLVEGCDGESDQDIHKFASRHLGTNHKSELPSQTAKCQTCKFMISVVGLGLGMRCKHPKNTWPDGFPALLPNRWFGCSLHELAENNPD